MLLYDPTCAQTSIVSGICAPAQTQLKDYLWAYLKDLNDVIDSPWCSISDFNELENFI